MKSSILLTAVLLLAFVGLCLAQDLPVLISPDTIALDGSPDYTLTVHAAIAYSAVTSVTLDGVTNTLAGTFPDSRDELVAKFTIEEKNLEPGTLNLTLTVDCIIDGVPVTLSGSEDISVIEKASQDGPGKDEDGPRQNQEGDRVGAE